MSDTIRSHPPSAVSSYPRRAMKPRDPKHVADQDEIGGGEIPTMMLTISLIRSRVVEDVRMLTRHVDDRSPRRSERRLLSRQPVTTGLALEVAADLHRVGSRDSIVILAENFIHSRRLCNGDVGGHDDV